MILTAFPRNWGSRLVFNKPFREEAAANRNRRQQLDHLLRVTAPHERIILACIGLVLVAAATWSVLGSIERSVTFDALLLLSGNRHEVVSGHRGHLVDLLVAVGDRVEAGKPIAHQSVPEMDREMEALRERMSLLESEITNTSGNGSGLQAVLADARVALLEMEAQRSVRESIVSQNGGRVVALRHAPGEYLPAGTSVALVLEGNEEVLGAVLRVADAVARRIRPGMHTEVELALPDGEMRQIDGEVTRITPGPLPAWLAGQPPVVVESLSSIEVKLHGGENLTLEDGTPCRVRVVLGRQTPAGLFEIGSV